MYTPKFFRLEEVLPKDFYHANIRKYGQKLWGIIFDQKLLRAMDILRNQCGQMTVNDWYWGGNNQYRGYRPFDCTIGAKLSQHRFGRAVDLIPKDISADEVRKNLYNFPFEMAGSLVTAFEEGISWVHIDVRNYLKTPENPFLIFRP
jgi:hypothetical protein